MSIGATPLICSSRRQLKLGTQTTYDCTSGPPTDVSGDKGPGRDAGQRKVLGPRGHLDWSASIKRRNRKNVNATPVVVAQEDPH